MDNDKNAQTHGFLNNVIFRNPLMDDLKNEHFIKYDTNQKLPLMSKRYAIKQ
jgi:hypothetical protein